ncbi:MAG: hypothetical protein ACI4OW_00285 [Alphaproteobacteria bacterium]
MQNFYLENSFAVIKDIENKYDTLPPFSTNEGCRKSVDKLCYNRTKAIAKAHQKKLSTYFLEEELKTYRDYAVKYK